MSSSINHQIFFVLESTYGVTPATPALIELPIVGTTLAVGHEMMASKTISAHRIRKDLTKGLKNVSGEISAEFSATNFDALIEAALGGTWAGTNPKTLTHGNTRRSFSFVRKFPDLTSGSTRQIFTGAEINNMAFTISTKDFVGLKFSVIAKNGVNSNGDPSGSTFPTMAQTKSMHGLSLQISEGGTPAGIVTELSISFENGLEARPVLGSDQTIRPKQGLLNVSGSLTMYFETMAMLDKLYAGTDTTLEFTLSADGVSYAFELPRLRLTDGKPEVQEANDILLTIPFTALYDNTSQGCMTLIRTAA